MHGDGPGLVLTGLLCWESAGKNKAKFALNTHTHTGDEASTESNFVCVKGVGGLKPSYRILHRMEKSPFLFSSVMVKLTVVRFCMATE